MLWDSYFLSCVAKWNFRESKSHGLCFTSAGDSVWWCALGDELSAHHHRQFCIIQYEVFFWAFLYMLTEWRWYDLADIMLCSNEKGIHEGLEHTIAFLLSVSWLELVLFPCLPWKQSCKCYVKHMPFCVCKSFVFWSFEQRTNFSVVLF